MAFDWKNIKEYSDSLKSKGMFCEYFIYDEKLSFEKPERSDIKFEIHFLTAKSTEFQSNMKLYISINIRTFSETEGVVKINGL